MTVWMNRIDGSLRRSLRRPIFQTWNPVVEPAAETILAEIAQAEVTGKLDVKLQAVAEQQRAAIKRNIAILIAVTVVGLLALVFVLVAASIIFGATSYINTIDEVIQGA